MIEIKSISGEVILSVPVLADAVAHQELMASDFVRLAWSSEKGDVIPAGSYIEHDGEKYSLMEPYQPGRVNELAYEYKPEFHSRIAVWGKQPACIYTYEDDGVTVKSREFDWSFAGSPADAMYLVLQSIRNETGEAWTAKIADSLPATIDLSSQTSSIQSVLSDIASQCETEYWVDKKNNVLHLSRCEIGDVVELTVGSNVKVPATTANTEGYYTRFYPLGSTRNVVQEARTSLSGIVNKRLTLDTHKYPYGYKDIRGHFENGVFVSDLDEKEVFSKVVVFDGIYPSADLVISDVRARLKYRIDEAGKKVIVGGTDEEPVYEQYAVWYFKIAGFNFDKDSIIAGKTLSAHFKNNQLAGRDFELNYYDKSVTEKTDGDVSEFTVDAGDYEIQFVEQNDMVIPGLAYIIPQNGDEVILFNIEMPVEYTQAAQKDLEEAIDKHIAEQTRDRNTYEFDSDAEAFYRSGIDLSLGQSVRYVNGTNAIETRVLMVEKHLDFPCEQRIRIGNEIIKGRSQELRDEVNSLNQNVNVLAAFNDLSQSIQDSYARTQAKVNEALAAYGEMFEWEEKGVTIRTKYNLYSEKEMSAGGQGEAVGTSGGGGIDPDELEDILNEKGYATEGYVGEQIDNVKDDIKAKPSTYVPLKTINGLSLYGSGNINVEGGGGSAEGLTAINVNEQSFQPDENGIVTLPDYPSALPSPKALVIGSKIYDGSSKVTILEDDIVEDIEDIRTKLGNLENYDDSEVKADIATLEGYFTNGKAKNADKLDGQDSTYFATAQSVSTLSTSVVNVTNDVSTLKNRVSTTEADVSTNKAGISELGRRMNEAEEEIADNGNGIKANTEDIAELDRRLDSIEAWYDAVGKKFTKDSDGTIKMDGDFYTTGENSAAGAGESIGSTGGGIDPEELEDILDEKGYATESWVNKQGFAKGTIPTSVSQLTNDAGYVTASDIPSVPTRVSQLENDANYLASITGEMVRSALTYTPFNSDNFTKLNIKSTLGISDWALATTKPSYSYSEIINAPNMSNYATKLDLDAKVDKVTGKGLSTNDYTDADKDKLASLENYDDTDVKDRISDLEEWYNEVGSKFSKESDGTIKMDGDFFTTGENSAGGVGESTGGNGGGGIDTEELDEILDGKGYATEVWVNAQGFAKGTIPTKTSQLTNNSDFITTATADGRYASAGDLSSLEERVQNIEAGGGTGSGDVDLSAYATKKYVDGELGKKVDKVEGMGLSENNYTDKEKNTLSNLGEWYETIGSRFSVEDGVIKMEGDFFTTGENSAGGIGESVGGTGGGLDESELEDYLTDNKYATQTWVSGQGYAKGTIPTKVSDLENDAKYLASITAKMVKDALGFTPFDSANFSKVNIKSTLGISDWALASTKPSYSYTELTNTPNLSNYVTTNSFTTAMSSKVDKVEGKGLSTNDYTNEDKSLLASVDRKVTEIEEWYNRVSEKLDYDIDEDAIVVTGDLHATGENSAGGLGEDIGEWGDIVSRLTALENSIGNISSQITQLANKVAALESSVGMQNVEIKVSSLAAYDGKTNMASAAMATFGLSVAVANKMLEGAYNKVIDKTNSSYPSVWNYSAYSTSTQIVIMLKQGDGFDVSEGYKLTYTRSSLQWSIFRDMI